MRKLITAAALLLCVTSAMAGQAQAQPGTSAATPFEESSAGRAMRRITFAAIDCTKDDFLCPNDAFTTSGLVRLRSHRSFVSNSVTSVTFVRPAFTSR